MEDKILIPTSSTTLLPSLPEVRLDHLRIMTDDTGIFQHAISTTPDRRYGYCTDDNARALQVAIMNWHLFQDRTIFPLLHTYLSFINYALNRDTGRFRNFLSYDRRWLEEVGSEDSHGRAIWSLGFTVTYAPDDSILALTTQLFNQSLSACQDLVFPRAWAYSIMGCLLYLQRFDRDKKVNHICGILAQQLRDLFSQNSTIDWPWLEEVVTYDNARLPQALILAGKWFKDENMINQGLRSLEWLWQIQTDTEDGHLSLIGNQGWFFKGKEKARFDQQPLEVPALIDACYEAYLLTKDEHWSKAINRCFNWFLGENDVQEMVYDFKTGGCRDGLYRTSVNQNQGGESTLAWLLALHRLYEIAFQSERKDKN